MNNSILTVKQMLDSNAFDKEILLDILMSFRDDVAVMP